MISRVSRSRSHVTRNPSAAASRQINNRPWRLSNQEIGARADGEECWLIGLIEAAYEASLRPPLSDQPPAGKAGVALLTNQGLVSSALSIFQTEATRKEISIECDESATNCSNGFTTSKAFCRRMHRRPTRSTGARPGSSRTA